MKHALRYFLFFNTLLFAHFSGVAQNLVFQWETCTDCTTAQYPTYNTTPVAMTSYSIAEDFGRREIGSRWHNGLDVNGALAGGERGYHIKSIAAGTITKIFRTGYKVILINGANNLDFAYGHIFMDSDVQPYRLGDMVLAPLTSHPNNYSAIIYDPSNVANAYCLTDAPLTGGTSDGAYSMTYTRQVNGVDVTTIFSRANGNLRNQVQAGDRIAPMGGSGGFEGSDHVHLYNFIASINDVTDFQRADNCKNPLNLLSYIQPTLTNTIQGITRGNGLASISGTGPFYGNIDIRARVKFNPEKHPTDDRYTETSPILDINKVEIHIKSEYSEPSRHALLKGANFESRIDYGARWSLPGSIRYPAPYLPANNTTGGDNSGLNGDAGVDIAQTKTVATSAAGYGDFRKTGILGSAYTNGYSPNTAYDEFYFNDYHTRIHKSDNFGKSSALLARRNEDARYPDGNYQLYVASQTVRNVTFNNAATPRTITIDNFMPYVKKLLVYPEGGGLEAGYERSWIWNNTTNSLTLGDDISTAPNYAEREYLIVVQTSEPMSAMRISIPSIGITNQLMKNEFTTDEISDGDIGPGAVWSFPLLDVAATPGTHPILLTGTDKANNPLLTSPTTIPYRDETGQWIPAAPATGQDANHSFTIEPSTCEDNGGRIAAACDLVADFTHILNGSDPFVVSFSDRSQPSSGIASYSWNFGDPGSGSSNTSTATNPTHRFSASGTYTVSLTVSDGSTTDGNTKMITIDNSAVSVNFTSDRSGGVSPLTVQLSGVTNLQNVTSWEWLITPNTYQFLTNPNVQSPTVQFTTQGTYTVSLRVTNGTTLYTSQPQAFLAAAAGAPIPQFSWESPTFVYSIVNIKDNSFFNCGPAVSEWTVTGPFGWSDTQHTTAGTPFSFAPNHPGSYQVELCVIDNCEQKQCLTKTIEVTTFQNTITPDFTASSVNIKRGQSIQFTDVTRDPNNKIVQHSWWLSHTPGTAFGVCERCYLRGEDVYTGIETKKYDVAGTFDVRLTVYEDIAFEGNSKTISINVEDNVLTFQSKNEASGGSQWGSPVRLQGEYAAAIWGSAVTVWKRSGNNWVSAATLQHSNTSYTLRDLDMDGTSIVVKAQQGIFIYEMPEGGWVNMSSETAFIPTLNNTLPASAAVALSGNMIAASYESSQDGSHTFVDTYEKIFGEWPVTPTQRLSVGYGTNSNIEVALDGNTLVIRQVDNSKQRFNQLAVYERSSSAGWVFKTNITRSDYYFAGASKGFDISGNTIVTVNRMENNLLAPDRVGYVYVKPNLAGNIPGQWTTGMDATGVLSLEFPEPRTTASTQAVIDGDRIALGIGKQVVFYQRPPDGWKSMIETARVIKPNAQSTDWSSISTPGVKGIAMHGNHLIVDIVTPPTPAPQHEEAYFYEIEPALCDDLQAFPQFNILSGQYISNTKGIVTVGGGSGTTAVINNGGSADFRAVDTKLLPGFNAKAGSAVMIQSRLCDF